MQERIARLFKNRGNAVVAGIVVALLAIVLLVIYLHSYRSSVNSGKQPERVLVATKLIPRGTSGKNIAQQGLYQVTSVQKDQLQAFAISDPAAIQGRLAANDIFPGQQLTQGDFTTENATSIPYELTGPQRAIAVSVDAEHGLIGQVGVGRLRRRLRGHERPCGCLEQLQCGCDAADPGAACFRRLRDGRSGHRFDRCRSACHSAGGAEVRLRGGQHSHLARFAAAGRGLQDAARKSYSGVIARTVE